MARILSTKEKNALKDNARKTANPADLLRGYTCPRCMALGQHYEDKCPVRQFVGVPEARRVAIQQQSLLDAMGCELPTPAAESMPATRTVLETATVLPGFISGQELQCILRNRPDVPYFLRCLACTQLAQDAVWCRTCDAVACTACLAPPDERWVCPQCQSHSEDNFHIVTSIRHIIDSWIKGMVKIIDNSYFADVKL
jgi:hypothetical protein